MAASWYSVLLLLPALWLTASAGPIQFQESNISKDAALLKDSSSFVVHSMSTSAPRTYPQNAMIFVELDGKNYLFVDQNATWMEAMLFCQAFGLDLVSIESQRENDLIRAQANAVGMSNKWIWLSANKIGRSTWIWINGESLIETFVNWGSGNPNDPTLEHCAFMISSGQWADYFCDEAKYASKPIVFVCEDNS